MDGHCSIKEAAVMLGISAKTVRSKISNGELPAVFEDNGVGLSRWWVSLEAIEKKNGVVSVVQPDGYVSMADVKRVVTGAVAEVVAEAVRGELVKFREEVEGRADERDRRLVEVMRAVQEERKKGFWGRLFG